MTELEIWKSIAFYLADCQAATAIEEGALASVSKSRKERHISICKKAVEMLEGKQMPPFSLGCMTPEQNQARIIERLHKVTSPEKRKEEPANA